MRKLTLLASLLASSAVWAKPPGPATFCQQYPAAPACVGAQPACTYCHTSPPTRNAYGESLESAMAPAVPRPLSDGDFSSLLPAALSAAESVDSDGDGFTNAVEIARGTQPGDARSLPQDATCAEGNNPAYTVCRYDARFAYRKVLLDFCGASPTYEELEAFDRLPTTEHASRVAAALARCLDSEFWRGKNGQLWQLAHRKVRPLGSLKDGPEDKGAIPLGDYYDDYALFVYSQTDGHDAREVLTANFYVQRSVSGTPPVTTYTKVSTLPRQAVLPARRAGNLTTTWNLVYNVMFTALPRNAASQAYRGYLGLDLAKQEGLYPIANEPLDYDAKGVKQALCAQCHSTLDPLSYPFKNYNGLTAPFAQYDPQRLENNFAGESPTITQTPEAGYILGQRVNDLPQWAQVAANSDAFAIATVADYWRLLLGQDPTPEQSAEFVPLWQRLKTVNGYDVEKMLQELVRTEAYGAP